MTRATLQPMISRELAEEALPVSCYVCGATNTLHAEYCRRCSAPMALSHQAPAGTLYSGSGSAARPKMVAVLGPSGAGKTVYLGMLMDMLSRQPQRLHIVARGAFSVGLQQTTVSALAHCEFPSKTGTEPECWNWVHCEIHREKAAASKPLSFSERLARFVLRKPQIASSHDHPCVELVMPDMAGEAILEEVQHPQTFSAIRSLLRNSAAAFLLIDAAELIRGHRDPDFAATKILSCLKEFGRRGQPAVAAAGRTGLHQDRPGRRLPREPGTVRPHLCRGHLATLPAGISRLCLLCRQRGRLLHVAGSPRRSPPPDSPAGRAARDHRALRMARGEAAPYGEAMRMAQGSAAVQQAIFTSAKTDCSAGYQILAASPGLAEVDRRELTLWGPSHDSLLNAGPEAVSLNFFPLPSGSNCVSRTTPAGWEYSGRGGHRIYTHCLIALPEALRQFANHPLVLLDAALAAGGMEPRDAVPPGLETLELRATLPAGAAGPLAQLAAEVGPAALALLVQAALNNDRLAVRGLVAPERLIRGLLDCLPVDCRTLFSFSTGLKFCARRPFALLALPDDMAQQRQLARQAGITALDLDRDPVSAVPLVNDWARLIHRVLATGNVAFLSEELARPRADLTLADLPVLALQLLDELEAAGAQPPPVVKARQAHAAHRRFQKTVASAGEKGTGPICAKHPEGRSGKLDLSPFPPPVISAPSELLDADSVEVIARLEALDDAVFDAVQGKAAALADLHELWPALKVELGEALLAESREQYIRYALSVWREPTGSEQDHDPTRAVNALEVLCVLFDEVR